MSRQSRERNQKQTWKPLWFAVINIQSSFPYYSNVYRIQSNVIWCFAVLLIKHVCWEEAQQLFWISSFIVVVVVVGIVFVSWKASSRNLFAMLLNIHTQTPSHFFFTHFNVAFTIAGAELSGQDYLHAHFWMSLLYKIACSSITQIILCIMTSDISSKPSIVSAWFPLKTIKKKKQKQRKKSLEQVL